MSEADFATLRIMAVNGWLPGLGENAMAAVVARVEKEHVRYRDALEIIAEAGSPQAEEELEYMVSVAKDALNPHQEGEPTP